MPRLYYHRLSQRVQSSAAAIAVAVAARELALHYYAVRRSHHKPLDDVRNDAIKLTM